MLSSFGSMGHAGNMGVQSEVFDIVFKADTYHD